MNHFFANATRVVLLGASALCSALAPARADCIRSPHSVGWIDTPGNAQGLTVVGGYAYVAEWDALRIIDVTTPATPRIVGALETPGIAQDVAVLGDNAYVADGELGGLRVIRVQPPGAPVSVRWLDTPGNAQGGRRHVRFARRWFVRIAHSRRVESRYDSDRRNDRHTR